MPVDQEEHMEQRDFNSEVWDYWAAYARSAMNNAYTYI